MSRSEAEIRFTDPWILVQRLGRIAEHDPARFQHIAPRRHGERKGGVLLDQQDRGAALMNLDRRIVDLVDDDGCKAEI